MADEPTERGAPEPGGEAGELPAWNRARVKRKKKGAGDDAFQAGARQAGRYARRKAPLVIGLFALLAAAVAGGIWVVQSRQEARAEATRILAGAVAVEARGEVGDPDALWGKDRPPPVPIAKTPEALDEQVERALAELEKTAPESPANLDAALVRGARALRKGDPSAAARQFQRFLDEAPSDHPLRFLALEGLGIAKEAAGDLDGALAVFDELAGTKGSFYRDQALAHKGRVLESLGRTKEAIEVYRTYATEFPLSEPSLALEFVQARLAELDPDFVAPGGETTGSPARDEGGS